MMRLAFACCLIISSIHAEEKNLPKQIQGKWKIAKIEGKVGRDEEYRMIITITKDEWSFQEGNKKPDVRNYKIDTTKSPTVLEMKSQRDGNISRAIVKVDGGKLYFCIGDPKGELSKEFKAEKAKFILITLERLEGVPAPAK